MDKDIYIEKCMVFLDDERVYKEYRDQIQSIHSKVVKKLLDVTKIKLDTNLRNITTNLSLQVTKSPSIHNICLWHFHIQTSQISNQNPSTVQWEQPFISQG